jgi:DNA-binding NarL/FixJ family response regulator
MIPAAAQYHPILTNERRMGASTPLRILIADDHPLVRQAMRLVFMDDGSEYEFIEADGLDSALDLLAANETDLLLMDLGMPGMAGADSLRALRETYPATKIAVITGQDDRGTILECLSAGVHGYILKASPVEEIMQAIASILAGRVYVTPALARSGGAQAGPQNSAESLQYSTPAPHGSAEAPRLTKRQAEVLRLLRQGQPTKQIARGLDLGIGTVKIHLAAVFRALNAKNRTEAALLAAKFNL